MTQRAVIEYSPFTELFTVVTDTTRTVLRTTRDAEEAQTVAGLLNQICQISDSITAASAA